MNKEFFSSWDKINGSFILNHLLSLCETIKSSIILVSWTLSVENVVKYGIKNYGLTVFTFLAISPTLQLQPPQHIAFLELVL